MIPSFDQNGVLPPFLPESSPTSRADVSPYLVDFSDFVDRFSTSLERSTIIEGFKSYCLNLQRLGLNTGDIWIDGSFTEDVEKNQSRPPRDVDLVFFVDPESNNLTREQWKVIFTSNLDTLHPQQSKDLFHCDAYIVDLSTHPMSIVNNTSYWFGLFSHQRNTNIWKGMLRLQLDDVLREVSQSGSNGEDDA